MASPHTVVCGFAAGPSPRSSSKRMAPRRATSALSLQLGSLGSPLSRTSSRGLSAGGRVDSYGNLSDLAPQSASEETGSFGAEASGGEGPCAAALDLEADSCDAKCNNAVPLAIPYTQ